MMAIRSLQLHPLASRWRMLCRAAGFRRAAGLALAVGVACGTSACGKPKPQTVVEAEAPVEKSPRPSMLNELDLTRAQERKIDALLENLYARFAGYDRARHVLLDEILLEIERGQLDRARLEPLAKEAVREFEMAYPVFLDTMNELHAILSLEQRRELMGMVASDEEEEMTAEERKEAREERIARMLDLTTAQKTRLYPSLAVLALKNWGLISHVRGGIKEGKEEFLSEDFNAHELDLAQDPRLLEMAELLYEAVRLSLDVLTEDQRKALVALIEARYR